MAGQALFAKGLWNSMVTAVGLKSATVTDEEALSCPYAGTTLWTGTPSAGACPASPSCTHTHTHTLSEE